MVVSVSHYLLGVQQNNTPDCHFIVRQWLELRVQMSLPLLICQGSWILGSSIILSIYAISWPSSPHSRIGNTSQQALQTDKAVSLE